MVIETEYQHHADILHEAQVTDLLAVLSPVLMKAGVTSLNKAFNYVQ